MLPDSKMVFVKLRSIKFVKYIYEFDICRSRSITNFMTDDHKFGIQ